MYRKITSAFFLVCSPIFLWAIGPGFQTTIQDQLRLKLENIQPKSTLIIRNQPVNSYDEIYLFYSDREFREIWSSEGVLTELAYEMRHEIQQSKFDGLNPEEYNLATLENFFENFEFNKNNKTENNPGDLADLDLLLTDAFFHLASHLERGKVDPVELKSNWRVKAEQKKSDYKKLLQEGYNSGSIRSQLQKLYPDFLMYEKGREVIRSLDERSKIDTLSWNPVKINKIIEVGDVNSDVAILRDRLIFWGYLTDYFVEDEKQYDSLMMKGLKEYQLKNGLVSDGIIGPITVQALNYSPRDLMDKASVNLERLRWLPDPFKNQEFILVNIANYQLDYFQDRDTLLSAKVIVGTEYHESPVFSAEMGYIVFSPYWHLPNSITVNEIIPAMRRNPNYLSEKNMEVVTNSGDIVDPSNINWSSNSFPYRIRQRPGDNNSLGLVKFMFPNQYSVYIHDTPARSLFDKKDRALSHGCIRVQNPIELAKLLLRNDSSWTEEKIQEAMHQSTEQVASLENKIPVVLLYLTFWTDSKGNAYFRPDFYGRDAQVLAFLKD